MIVPGDPYIYRCPNCPNVLSTEMELTSCHCMLCGARMAATHATRPEAPPDPGGLFDPPAPTQAAARAKPAKKLGWGTSLKNQTHRYECVTCERTWVSHSEQSKCSGCRGIYHPVKAYGDGSRIVIRNRDLIVEQLHLGM